MYFVTRSRSFNLLASLSINSGEYVKANVFYRHPRLRGSSTQIPSRTTVLILPSLKVF